MNTLIQILSHTPVFVWALLAGLVALGLMQSRTRRLSTPQVLALPAVLLGLGLWSMLPGMSSQPVVGLLWLAAVTLGAAGGRRTPMAPGTSWLPEVRRFHLPGSWIPMGFILFIFMLRYSSSVAMVMHPEWRSTMSVQLPLALVFGLLSGLSLGRALGLLGLARRTGAANTMAAHA